MGSYPTWSYRRELDLTADTRHVTTSWNLNLARALARRSNLEVHFFTLVAGIPKSRTLTAEAGLQIHFLAMPRWKKALDLATELRLSTRLLKGHIDRVSPHIVHGIGTEHPYAHVAPKLAYPHVITVHGVMTRVVEAMDPPLWSPKRAFARLERATLRSADHVIAINPYVRTSLPISDAAGIYDVENPIDPLFFATGMAGRERRGLAFVGMIQPRKGLDILISALGRARGQTILGPVHIVGPTVPGHEAYTRDVHRLAAELGITDRLTWHGRREANEVARLLRSVRALILPAREETAPMVIAEALASGAAVVATDVGGVRHMVIEGETGFVVHPDDWKALVGAVHRLDALDPVQVETRARAEAVRRYHPERVAEQTEHVYRRVLADGT